MEKPDMPLGAMEFKGSDLEGLLKRAGKIIQCGFHVFTIRRKTTGEWRNFVIFEDMEKKEFCHVFDLGKGETLAMMALLMQGVETMEKIEKEEGHA